MRIVWDERKRLANLDKHGLDFADIAEFDWESAAIEPSYGGRLKAVGRVADGTAVVIFATLGREAISIISFRPAHRKEREVLTR